LFLVCKMIERQREMQEREGLRGTPFRRDRALGSVGTSEIT